MFNRRIVGLIDHLRSLDPKHFDMKRFTHNDCNSPACIAGHACFLYLGYVHKQAFTAAQELLDLDYGDAISLFTPSLSSYPNDPYNATPQEAANVLAYFMSTGKVDWQLFLSEKEEKENEDA